MRFANASSTTPLQWRKQVFGGSAISTSTSKEKAYEMGDQWMRNIARLNRKAGIPTIVDEFKDTYPTNYPMTDAALYYGWYNNNANGPLLNPRFKFKRGAVAMHLHSFSAANIGAGLTKELGRPHPRQRCRCHRRKRLGSPISPAPTTSISSMTASSKDIPSSKPPTWRCLFILGNPSSSAIHSTVPFSSKINRPPSPKTTRNIGPCDLRLKNGVPTPTPSPSSFVALPPAWPRALSMKRWDFVSSKRTKSTKPKPSFNQPPKSIPAPPTSYASPSTSSALHRRFGEKEAALQVIAEARQRFGDIPEAKALIGLKNIIKAPAPPAPLPARLNNST